MTPTLDGSWAKFRWAADHLNSLHKEIVSFVDEGEPPHRYEGEFDPQTGIHIARLHIVREPDWTNWGLRLGDVIHNARSALDHAVWQLVLLNGEKPGRTNQFPIAGHGRQYWCARKDGTPSVRDRDLRGVAEEHRTLIDALQPYRAGHEARDHALTGLAYLSNVDKHQVIHSGFFLVAEPDPAYFSAEVNADVGEQVEIEVQTGALKDGADAIIARFEVTGPNPRVKMKGQIPTNVGFSERGYTLTQVVALVGVVETILGQVETVF